MALIFCSLSDLTKYAKGQVYCTTIGQKGMGEFKQLDCLKPEWEMVRGHKERRVSDQEYKDRYRQLMKERWSEVRAWLKGLQAGEDMTLICYCGEGKFCHRRIIAALVKHERPDLEIVIH